MHPARRPSDALLGWTIDVDSRRRTHANPLSVVIFPGEGGWAPGAITPSTSADSRWGALVLTTVRVGLRDAPPCAGVPRNQAAALGRYSSVSSSPAAAAISRSSSSSFGRPAN